MNSVGIDISKGRSTIAVMRPFGEVVISPFEVRHTGSELSKLAKQLKSLDGETRVVMEATGNYHASVAKLLHNAGLYVSVINAKLVHGYGNNELRRVKTDRKDAVKLANYGLDRWLTLPRYIPEEDTRLLLKNCYRQYRQYSKVQTVLKNNLISLLDTVFPNANRLFSSPIRGDGSEKWVDFVAEFWHCRCASEKSERAFTSKYLRWCRKHGYNFREAKAHTIYAEASGHIGVMPKSETTKLLVKQAVSQLRATSTALAALKQEMQSLASVLPEYPVVMAIKHMANDTPVSKERLIAANTIGRSRVKQIVLKYGFTNATSNFVDFKILLIIVTFLACKHYNFINGGRLNGQVRETANIFGFHQCLKSRRECTNTSRLIFQIIGQFLNSTFYNAEHIYKIIFAASKEQLAITDVGNIIGCPLQIACDMGG